MSASGEKRTTMPKNFTQPLTCFYWHTYGYCNKSDDQCLYAEKQIRHRDVLMSEQIRALSHRPRGGGSSVTKGQQRYCSLLFQPRNSLIDIGD